MWRIGTVKIIQAKTQADLVIEHLAVTRIIDRAVANDCVLLMMIHPQNIILVVRGVPSICPTDDDTYHTEEVPPLSIFNENIINRVVCMFFLPPSHSLNRFITGIINTSANNKLDTKIWWQATMARTIVRTNPKINTIYLTQHCNTAAQMECYIKGTMLSVASSSLRDILHLWWSVRKVSLVESFRGIPNANIHDAFNERKYYIVYLPKKIAGCLFFFLYWNTIAAPPGKGQKNELHGENITSRKYSTNVPLFNSNTNPIINNNTLDATLQHTMETIYLML